MKIKRFCAPDMREALRLVKEQLGADAVILSNNRVEDGVEIVAAKDYDEQAIQAAADKKEALFDSRLDAELKKDRVSIDWNEAPKQAYREDYTPSKKKAVREKEQVRPKAAKKTPIANKHEWFEDRAIKAGKHKLDMMRHEFRTTLNELS